MLTSYRRDGHCTYYAESSFPVTYFQQLVDNPCWLVLILCLFVTTENANIRRDRCKISIFVAAVKKIEQVSVPKSGCWQHLWSVTKVKSHSGDTGTLLRHAACGTVDLATGFL